MNLNCIPWECLLHLLVPQASLSASPHLSYGDRRLSSSKDNPEPPLTGCIWIGQDFSQRWENICFLSRRSTDIHRESALSSFSLTVVIIKAVETQLAASSIFACLSRHVRLVTCSLEISSRWKKSSGSFEFPSQVFYSLFRHWPTICPDNASYC